jgi:hypothetical protein
MPPSISKIQAIFLIISGAKVVLKNQTGDLRGR